VAIPNAAIFHLLAGASADFRQVFIDSTRMGPTWLAGVFMTH
jgi:hypothetical protein